MFHEYERLPCVHRQYHNVLDCIICTFVYHSNFLHLPTEAVPFCGRVSSLELRRRSHVLPDVPPSSILPNKFMHSCVCTSPDYLLFHNAEVQNSQSWGSRGSYGERDLWMWWWETWSLLMRVHEHNCIGCQLQERGRGDTF